MQTQFVVYSVYSYPPACMNVLFKRTFQQIHGAPVTMGDRRHRVLSHPIKEHNRRRSACHGQACLYVGQSVYSSASCRADRSSNTYLQILKSTVGRSASSFVQMHARFGMSTLAHTCTDSLPFQKWHIMATENENLKPMGSKGLRYHTIPEPVDTFNLKKTQNTHLQK